MMRRQLNRLTWLMHDGAALDANGVQCDPLPACVAVAELLCVYWLLKRIWRLLGRRGFDEKTTRKAWLEEGSAGNVLLLYATHITFVAKLLLLSLLMFCCSAGLAGSCNTCAPNLICKSSDGEGGGCWGWFLLGNIRNQKGAEKEQRGEWE